MSIITEALKKAEQDRKARLAEPAQVNESSQNITTQVAEGTIPVEELETSHSVLPLPIQALASGPQAVSFRMTWFQAKDLLILGVILSVCVLVLVGLFYWPHSTSPELAAISSGLSPATPGLPKAKPAVRLPFVLTGISVQGADRYGIVNGLVVQKGDSVDGAIVKDITARDVVLESRAGEIKLRLPD